MMLRPILMVSGLCLVLSACNSPAKPTHTVTNVLVSGTAPAVGASLPFTATAVFSDGKNEDVTSLAAWQSSNPGVLTISSSGVATGVSAGTATVTATYQSVSGGTPAVVTAVTCNFTVSPLAFSLPKSGGTVTINVQMTGGPACAWDAMTPHSFIRLVSGSSGVGNGTIVAEMDPNLGLGRQGSIIVSRRFVVIFNQGQADCVASLSPVPQSLLPAGGFVTVNVNAPAGCTWTGTLPSRLVSFAFPPTGSGNGYFDVNVGPNGTGATRLNEVTVEQLKVVIPQSTPQGTYFSATSDAADQIGFGKDYLVQAPQNPLSASAASTNEARFTMQAPSPYFTGNIDHWDLTLRAPNGQPLVPGTYLNASGSGAAPAQPYLNLKRGGLDCQPNGFFTVHEAVYGPGPSVTRFWATFQQSCPGSPTQILRGEISFGR